MTQTKSLFLGSIDQTLYHYTGIGSLLGMASSNSIWASHAYYLNDAKEVLHACEVLNSAVEPRIVSCGLSAEEIDFARQLLMWVKGFQANRYSVFIFSLSEERSLLSQWRSYTPHGKGVSIGFSGELLSRLIRENGLRIARCIYDEQDQSEVLFSLFEELLVAFRQQKPSINPSHTPAGTHYFSFLEQFRNDVLQVLAIIKHHAFKEEREWRLISKYFEYYTDPKIEFREGASMLLPYIKLDLGAQRPIFQTVILGPSPHEELSFSALHMFLAKNRLCNVTENSLIPYREW